MPDSVGRAYQINNGNIAFSGSMRGRRVAGFLQDLESQRRVSFLFNPERFTESYEAVYARHGAPGLSHERMQYVGNKNAQIPLSLVYDEYFIRQGFLDPSSVGRPRRLINNAPESDVRVASQTSIGQIKRFFQSVVYPGRAQGLLGTAPPPLLFVWPGEVSMRVLLTKLKFNNVMFDVRRQTRILVVDVSLEEDVQGRIYSDEVFQYGAQRPWATLDNGRNG